METRFLLAALVSLFLLGSSLTQQRTGVIGDQVEAEVGLRATGLAVDLLDGLAALPFDSAGVVTSPTELTPAGGFGQPGPWATATDLDDVDGATVMRSVAADGEQLFLDAVAEVRYVTRSGGAFVPSATSTYHKEVVLQVTGPGGVAFTTSRVYSYE